MALTLLQMCTEALEEKAEFSVPATIIGNTNPTALRLRRAANRTGRTLRNLMTWQAMIQTYTFPTVASTETYALPSDFHRFINYTQWDRTNYSPLLGPQSGAAWEYVRSGSVTGASQVYSVWRHAAGLFAIRPIPTSVRTIAYQYIGNYWIAATGSSTLVKEYFTVDSDTCIFDDDLMVLGIKERFDAIALGVDFVPSAEYQANIDAAVAKDGGKPVIKFGPPSVFSSVLGEGNISEGNFG